MLNNFVFNNVNYLQKMGKAMGTRAAPSYSNIFMGSLKISSSINQDGIDSSGSGDVILMTYFLFGRELWSL